MSKVVAERDFLCGVSPVSIRVFEPRPDQADWRCEYEISWPGTPRHSYAMGVDSFQALQLALFKISTDIATSDDFKSGRLAIFGAPFTTETQVNQLFPIPWNLTP